MTAPLPPPLSERQSAILAAALAVFSEKGIVATTIDDIRQRSQASVGSIYHHFGNKENIAAAVFAQGLDHYWSRLIERVTPAEHAEQAITLLIDTHIRWIVEQPDYARFLFARREAVTPEHDQAIRQRTGDYFKMLFALFQPWHKQGILRRLPMQLYYPVLLGPAQEHARLWLSGRSAFDPRDAIEELSRAAWRSIASEAALALSLSADRST
jgi:AcrR family transcriptional regulator